MSSIKRTARFAGFLYLVVFLLGIFGELFVRQGLYLPENAGVTASNLMASDSLFRLSLVTDLVRQAVLVLLPLVLYRILKPVSKGVAAVMAVFALVTVPIAMVTLLFQFAALLPLSGAGYLNAFDAEQLHAQMMYFFGLNQYGVYIAQFFGFWVSLLGFLVYKSGFLPRILGILLIIAGLGYLVDAVLFLLFPSV
ncbi:MAG: DUF4386 domain-containing protein, partial [Anaerolineales bacterium]